MASVEGTTVWCPCNFCRSDHGRFADSQDGDGHGPADLLIGGRVCPCDCHRLSNAIVKVRPEGMGG